MGDRSITIRETPIGVPFKDYGEDVQDVIETSVIYVKGRGNMVEVRVVKQGDWLRSFALIGGICQQTYLDNAKRFSRKKLNDYAATLRTCDKVRAMENDAYTALVQRKAEGKMY